MFATVLLTAMTRFFVCYVHVQELVGDIYSHFQCEFSLLSLISNLILLNLSLLEVLPLSTIVSIVLIVLNSSHQYSNLQQYPFSSEQHGS